MAKVVINLQADEKTKKMAERKAKKMDMTVSAWIRWLIRTAK